MELKGVFTKAPKLHTQIFQDPFLLSLHLRGFMTEIL